LTSANLPVGQSRHGVGGVGLTVESPGSLPDWSANRIGLSNAKL